MPFQRFKKKWTRFWMRRAGAPVIGSIATSFAAWFVPPYYGLVPLARMNQAGFRSPRATIHHRNLVTGKHCFVAPEVLIYQDKDGGAVRLGDAVHLHRGIVIQTGAGGSVVIEDDTHIQPYCQISAYEGQVRIGRRVEIAPRCAFYPYNHGMVRDVPIRQQPVYTRGGISIGDDAWLGYGVIVLDGARIGQGAVIGAGSVVTGKIPDYAIATGVPARVVKHRTAADRPEPAEESEKQESG